MRKTTKVKIIIICWLTLLLVSVFLIAAPFSHAMDGKFSWLPNQESDLAGYKIHYGTTSGQYEHVIDCGLPETVDGRVHYTIANIPDDLTYYAATAYDKKGHESDYSNEISYDPVPSAPADFKAITVTVQVEVH